MRQHSSDVRGPNCKFAKFAEDTGQSSARKAIVLDFTSFSAKM